MAEHPAGGGRRDELVRAKARNRSGAQVGQARQHPPVVLLGRRQVQLGEDARDVLLDRALGHDELRGDRVVERPSAISPSTSRSRGLSSDSGSSRRRRPSSRETTSGSSALPPSPPRLTASTKRSRSATRSLSR